jgi:nucleotide-binding universal stress UspA family protein
MTVVVGVKRSSDSRAAIRLAAQEALYRDTTLIAVMAYPAERGWAPAVKPGATSLTRADDRAVADNLLREAVSDALGDAAERVEHRVVAVADLAGRALVRVAQTEDAQLLVLAARHGIARVLGTVSQYVLRNAPCPVLTVPEADIDSRGLETAQRHSTSPTA